MSAGASVAAAGASGDAAEPPGGEDTYMQSAAFDRLVCSCILV